VPASAAGYILVLLLNGLHPYCILGQSRRRHLAQHDRHRSTLRALAALVPPPDLASAAIVFANLEAASFAFRGYGLASQRHRQAAAGRACRWAVHLPNEMRSAGIITPPMSVANGCGANCGGCVEWRVRLRELSTRVFFEQNNN
jgi:hypothetical protein